VSVSGYLKSAWKECHANAHCLDTGANASAEEAEEGTEDAAVQVNNVVNSFRLQSTSFDKKSYLTHLKGIYLALDFSEILLMVSGYMKAVKQKMKEANKSDEEIAEFEKGAQSYAKKIVGNFKDYDFYVGESMDPDAMVVLMNYREDGTTPFVTVWKHGLKQEKV
jgi:hypothetical protein